MYGQVRCHGASSLVGELSRSSKYSQTKYSKVRIGDKGGIHTAVSDASAVTLSTSKYMITSTVRLSMLLAQRSVVAPFW